MFDTLTEKLGKVFDGLTGRGALSDGEAAECPLCADRRSPKEQDWLTFF
jgi:hypothetical protein